MKAIDVKAYLKGNKLHIEIDLSDTPADLDFSFIKQGELIDRAWVAKFRNRPMPMIALEKALKDRGRADLIEIIEEARSKLYKGRRMTVPKVMDLLFPERETTPAPRVKETIKNRRSAKEAQLILQKLVDRGAAVPEKYSTLALFSIKASQEEIDAVLRS